MPAGHAMEWNGRRILVWNTKDAQNRMEDSKNGMEDRLPYFHTNYTGYISKLPTNYEGISN